MRPAQAFALPLVHLLPSCSSTHVREARHHFLAEAARPIAMRFDQASVFHFSDGFAGAIHHAAQRG